MTDVFDLSGPTISHRLRVLREAGLISGQRRGTSTYHLAHTDVLGSLASVPPPRAAA